MAFPWEIGLGDIDADLFRALQEAVDAPRVVRTPSWASVRDFGAAGDGVTDDTAAVQRAISVASVVYFPSGTYRIGTIGEHVRVFGRHRLALVGDGACSKLVRGQPDEPRVEWRVRASEVSAPLDASWAEGMFEFDGCSDITIRGLRIDPNGFTPRLTGSDIVEGQYLIPAEAEDPLPATILFRNCSRVRVAETSFHEVDSFGYWLGGLRAAASGHRYCLALEGCQDVVIASNHFTRVGLHASDVRDLRIVRNVFEEVQGHAIALDAGLSNLAYVDVTENLVRQCTGFGILVEVTGGEDRALDVRHVRVLRNVLREPSGLPGGIVVYAGVDLVNPEGWGHRDLSIVGNIVDFPNDGIREPRIAEVPDRRESPLNLVEAYGILLNLWHAPESEADQAGVFKFCRVQDNTVRNCKTDGGTGVALALSNIFGGVVSGNSVFGGNAGLRLSRSYRCHIHSNTVERSDTGVEYEIAGSYGDNVFSANAVLGSPHRVTWAGSGNRDDEFMGGDEG